MAKPRSELTFPGTDFVVGPASLGTITFGGQVHRDEAAKIVEVARESDITMFDTANSYGEGMSEEILGEIVRPFRDEVLIATKVGSRRIAKPDERRLSAEAIRVNVEDSLRRLGTDVIDLYYLHVPDRDVPVEETLEAMDELVRAGKVRHIGQSNYAAWEITQMRAVSERRGFSPIRVSQVMFNMLARRPEGSYADCTSALGIGNVVYNPLAGGLLTGKYASRFGTSGSVEGTRFERDLYKERYWNKVQHQAVTGLMSIAQRAGVSLVELALRWVKDQPLVSTVLLGASSASQLAENMRAMREPPLPEDVLDEIDQVWHPLAGAAPRYWR